MVAGGVGKRLLQNAFVYPHAAKRSPRTAPSLSLIEDASGDPEK
jgi:hypothetical protein